MFEVHCAALAPALARGAREYRRLSDCFFADEYNSNVSDLRHVRVACDEGDAMRGWTVVQDAACDGKKKDTGGSGTYVGARASVTCVDVRDDARRAPAAVLGPVFHATTPPAETDATKERTSKVRRRRIKAAP